MKIVVSDTSPIRALYFLGLSALLRKLFDGVIVPTDVADELTQPRAGFEPIDLATLPIEIRAPQDRRLLLHYAETLDRGEAQAIALAIELKAALLIDERAGRVAAARAGIPYTGVLGILTLAKRAGMIAEVRPLLDKLRGELRFRIAQNLYDDFLKSIGE
jgi:predicted nucleic acid-binding protein